MSIYSHILLYLSKIRIPDEMPKEIQTLVKGLITVDYTKRWGYEEIQCWLKGEDVPVHYQIKEISYQSYKFGANEVASSPEELANILEKNPEKGKKHLYSGKLSAWVNLFDQGLAVELDSIVEEDYPKDHAAGLQKAIYLLDSDKGFVSNNGIDYKTIEDIVNVLEKEYLYYAKELANPTHAFYLYLEVHDAKTEADIFRKCFSVITGDKAITAIISALKGDMSSVNAIISQQKQENNNIGTPVVSKLLPDAAVISKKRIVSANLPEVVCLWKALMPIKEVYQEKVVIQPGGLFKRAVTQLQDKTREVFTPFTVEASLHGIRDEIYDVDGNIMTNIEFCHIPAGTFMMGQDKKHQVTITRDFMMGKYPVTVSQWKAIMGSSIANVLKTYNEKVPYSGPNAPITCLSWLECNQFINKLNTLAEQPLYKLPTEAEWEYACRAGSDSAYCFGDDISLLGDYGWHHENSSSSIPAVGEKKSNRWGLHDMHGLVREWCYDWQGDYAAQNIVDPKGPASGDYRINRGVCWTTEKKESITDAHCGSSFSNGPKVWNRHTGFRLARRAGGANIQQKVL